MSGHEGYYHIDTTVWPCDADGMHGLTTRARLSDDSGDEGPVIGALRAYRLAPFHFSIEARHLPVHLFDDHAASASVAAEWVRRNRSAIAKHFRSDWAPGADETTSFLILDSLIVSPGARGSRIGIRLMLEMQRVVCAGSPVLATLIATPTDPKELSAPALRKARQRLMKYYASDPRLGFESIKRGAAACHMVAVWDIGREPNEAHGKVWITDKGGIELCPTDQ